MYQDKTCQNQDTPPQGEVLMMHLQTPASVGRKFCISRVVPTSTLYNQRESIKSLVTRLCLSPELCLLLPSPTPAPGSGQPVIAGVFHFTTESIIVPPLPRLPLSLGVWNRAKPDCGDFVGEYGQG